MDVVEVSQILSQVEKRCHAAARVFPRAVNMPARRKCKARIREAYSKPLDWNPLACYIAGEYCADRYKWLVGPNLCNLMVTVT